MHILMLLAMPRNGISLISALSVYLSALYRDAVASKNFADRHQPGCSNPCADISFTNLMCLMMRKHLVYSLHCLLNNLILRTLLKERFDFFLFFFLACFPSYLLVYPLEHHRICSLAIPHECPSCV